MKYAPQLHKLSNGITVILDPMDLETVNVEVTFATGARDEGSDEMGILHFCEHMLCAGTRRFPTRRELTEYLEYNGGVQNAATGCRSMRVYGRILAENINLLIESLGDLLQNSLFDPEKIETERRVISDELRRALDSDSRRYFDFISGKLFNYVIGSSRTIGTFETIASFTRDQMLGFLSRRLSAKNCIIGISGKIHNPDDVLKTLEKTFSFLPGHDVPENMDITYTPTIAHNHIGGKKNVKITILFPDYTPDSYENIFRDKCLSVFEWYTCKELYEIIRRQNGLTYGFGDAIYGNEQFCCRGFATQTTPENIARLIELIAKNASYIYSHSPFTADDLSRRRNICKLGNADWLESPQRRITKLINFYRLYGRLYDFNKSVQMGDSITRDDVIMHSRGYFDGPMSIITHGADHNTDVAAIWHENFTPTAGNGPKA